MNLRDEGAPTHFVLVGGEFDGTKIPTTAFDAWPSWIWCRASGHLACVYTMRIGDLERYDYQPPRPVTVPDGWTASVPEGS